MFPRKCHPFSSSHGQVTPRQPGTATPSECSGQRDAFPLSHAGFALPAKPKVSDTILISNSLSARKEGLSGFCATRCVLSVSLNPGVSNGCPVLSRGREPGRLPILFNPFPACAVRQDRARVQQGLSHVAEGRPFPGEGPGHAAQWCHHRRHHWGHHRRTSTTQNQLPAQRGNLHHQPRRSLSC